MSTSLMRVMVIQDASKNEVYGQIIRDDDCENEFAPSGATDAVVRAYMTEFCSDCYIRGNEFDKGPLPDTFEGRVATIASEMGAREYTVVVKILKRPVDGEKILKYHNKSFKQWEPALELYRGNPDPRALDEPDLKDVQREVSWNVFKQTFALVCLAMVASLVVGSFTGNDRT